MRIQQRIITALLLAWACGAVPSVYSQGVLVFANRTGLGVPPGSQVNAPFFDSDGTTRLAGSGYRAALYIGPTGVGEASMTLVSAGQAFQTAAAAGYWVSADVTVPPGVSLDAQVRFWDTQGGTLASFPQALQAGAKVGISKVLHLVPAIDGKYYLSGLTSVSLMPSTPLLTRGVPFTITDVMAVPNGHQLTNVCDQTIGRSRWLTARFGIPGEAVVTTEGSAIDTVLAVYRRCATEVTLCQFVACNDNASFGESYSEVRFQAETNAAYMVMVAGSGGTTGVVQVTVSLPLSLDVRPRPGGLELHWPTDATNCVLESASNLVPPINWQPVTNLPVAGSNGFTLQLNAADECRIFRLRQPAAP